MDLRVDYLLVGSGLTGATAARMLWEAGREVLVVERRSCLGGNAHDFIHLSGIRVQTYGPHYFRTSSEEIWEFVNRFAPFYKYEAVVKAYIDGRYESWPIAGSYVRRVAGEQWTSEFVGIPTNFEEASLAVMPRVVYEKFIRGYVEKQWGTPPHTLSASLMGRIDLREDNDDDPRVKRSKYQGIPYGGYTGLVHSMLEGIPVLLNFDYLRHRHSIKARNLLIFTGPIDEFFGFDLGRLAYRGQEREHIYLPDVDYAQPYGQVNNPDPDNGQHIRTLEWKRLMPREIAERISGTVLTKEVPFSPASPNDYEYPFPDGANAKLYKRYRVRVEETPRLLICGRLGEYQYYDMDQAILRAINLTRQILEE